MIKILFYFLALTFFTIPVVDAVPLSDMTGFKFTFPVKLMTVHLLLMLLQIPKYRILILIKMKDL